MTYAYAARNDGTCSYCGKPFVRGGKVCTASTEAGFTVVHLSCMQARLKKPRAIEEKKKEKTTPRV